MGCGGSGACALHARRLHRQILRSLQLREGTGDCAAAVDRVGLLGHLRGRRRWQARGGRHYGGGWHVRDSAESLVNLGARQALLGEEGAAGLHRGAPHLYKVWQRS